MERGLDRLSTYGLLKEHGEGYVRRILDELVQEGCRVRAFVFYNSFNSWGWLDSLPKKKLSEIEVFAGDIRDPNGVREAIKGVDIIFHLAALISIPFSYQSPDFYLHNFCFF